MNRRELTKGQNEYDEITAKLMEYRMRLSITNERNWLYLIECEEYNLANHLQKHN